MSTVKEAMDKIKAIGIREYFNSMFTRSYGRAITFQDPNTILITSENVVFHMGDGKRDYYLTVKDIVYLIRYVRFLSILLSILIVLMLVFLVIRS